MQPPYTQPLQAKGQPVVMDFANENHPPVMASPAKAGHVKNYGNVRTASFSHAKPPSSGMATSLPVDTMRESPSSFYYSAPTASSHTVSQQQLASHQHFVSVKHPSASVSVSQRASPMKKIAVSDDGGKSYKLSSVSHPQFTVVDSTHSFPEPVMLTTTQTHVQEDTSSRDAFHTRQPPPVTRAKPHHVPVTTQIFVSIPSGPMSCPPPASPASSTAIRRMTEPAERDSDETDQVIVPIKLQDPPRCKIKRRLPPDSDNVASAGSSSKTYSPTKNKFTDLSRNVISHQPLPSCGGTTPKVRGRCDVTTCVPEGSVPCQPQKSKNSRFGEVMNSPTPGNVPPVHFKNYHPPELKSTAAHVISSPTKQDPNSSFRFPPSSSHLKLSSSKKSREKNASPYHLRHTKPGMAGDSLHTGQTHIKGSTYDTSSNNDNCVSIIYDESRQPTAINLPITSNGLIRQDQYYDQKLRSEEEPVKTTRRLHQSTSNNRKETPKYVFSHLQSHPTMSSKRNNDEVDGMDTFMECDDDSSYNSWHSTSVLTSTYPNEYRRIQASTMKPGHFSNTSAMNYEHTMNPSSSSLIPGNSYDSSRNFTPNHETTFIVPPSRDVSSSATHYPTSTTSRHNTMAYYGAKENVYDDSKNYEMHMNPHSLGSQWRFPSVLDQGDATPSSYPMQRKSVPSGPGFKRDRTDIVSSMHASVPYTIDQKGCVVVESEQVEDNSSNDILACVSSDEENLTNSFSQARTRTIHSDFNINSGDSADRHHVVQTRADTNVHIIHPSELYDSSSMSCEEGSDRSDNSNTSLPFGDCGPENKFSRSNFGHYDETDGGSSQSEKLELTQQASKNAETISIRMKEIKSCRSQISATATLCKALSNDFLVAQTEKRLNNAMRAKSCSSESILCHNLETGEPKSEYTGDRTSLQGTPRKPIPNPDSYHSLSMTRSFQDQAFDHSGVVLTNNISRTQTFENLSALPPKLIVEHRRFTRKPHREKRTGTVSSRVHRRKQNREFHDNEKWSSSPPGHLRSHNHRQPFQRKPKQSQPLMDDLRHNNNYERNPYGSDDSDGSDEVDGLGDDIEKSTAMTQSGRLNTRAATSEDHANDIVHCSDQRVSKPKGKDNDIVTCFDDDDDGDDDNDNQAKSRHCSNMMSQDFSNVVDKDSLTQTTYCNQAENNGRVHCFSDKPESCSREFQTQKASQNMSYEGLVDTRSVNEQFTLPAHMRHRSSTMNSISLNHTHGEGYNIESRNVFMEKESRIKTNTQQQYKNEDFKFARRGKKSRINTHLTSSNFENVQTEFENKDTINHPTSNSSNDLSSTYSFESNFGISQRESSKSMPNMAVVSDEMEFQMSEQPQELSSTWKKTTKSPTTMRTKLPSRAVRRRGSKDVDMISSSRDSICRQTRVHRSVSSDQMNTQGQSNNTTFGGLHVVTEPSFGRESRSGGAMKPDELGSKHLCMMPTDGRIQNPARMKSMKVLSPKQKKSPKLYRPWLSSPPLRSEVRNNPSITSNRDFLSYDTENRIASKTIHSTLISSFPTASESCSPQNTSQMSSDSGFGKTSSDNFMPFHTPSFVSGGGAHRDFPTSDYPMSALEHAEEDRNSILLNSATMTQHRQTRKPIWDKRKSDGDASHPLLSSTAAIEPFDSVVIRSAGTMEQNQNQRNITEKSPYSFPVRQGAPSITVDHFVNQSNLNKSSPSKPQHHQMTLLPTFSGCSNATDRTNTTRDGMPTMGSISLKNVRHSTKCSAVTKLDFGRASMVSQTPDGTPTRFATQSAQSRSDQAGVLGDVQRQNDEGTSASAESSFSFKSKHHGSKTGDRSEFKSAMTRRATKREKDEIDVRIQVTDVMAETRNLGQRLEDIYQSNRGDCDCARVEREVLETALAIFGKVCAAPETQANFIEELGKTNAAITDALEMAESLRQLCRHGRRVSDVFPGSIILRLKCKTLMAVLDLCDLHKTGELHALLFVILRMRQRDLAPGLTLKVMIDDNNIKTCLNFISSKISFLMKSRIATVQKDNIAKKKSPAKRVVRSTENLLSSPSSPRSPQSVHERWKSTPVLPTCSPVTSPMYVNSPTFPQYKRERKFSFGDTTRSAFQELNLSDADSSTSSVKEELWFRRDIVMKRLFSPTHMTSSRPPTSPLSQSPSMRLKTCDIIQEQENIVHAEEREAGVYRDLNFF